MGKEPRMVGREDEMEKLLDLLIEGDPRLATISIVGEEGLGKTTLAAEAYNSVYVKNYFDCRAWVHVSSKSTEEELLDAIRKSVVQFAETNGSIYEHLTGRKFLIVFDNASETYLPGKVKGAFPDDVNGSRLLLTTTAKWMAHEAAPSLPLALSALNIEQSWEMLVNMVFEHNNCPVELKDLGISLVKKCHGFPLAILLLGSLLSKKEKKSCVWSIVEIFLPGSRDDSNWQFFKMMMLFSYNDLPYYLTTCLLYFAIFPEDSKVSTRQLFQLWIAEGFIHENFEATAEEYLDELIDRGFIQVLKRRSDGRVKTCKIHDLVLEFIAGQACRDGFVQNQELHHKGLKCSRLTIHVDLSEIISLKYFSPNLLSFVCLLSKKQNLTRNRGKNICESFEFLRILNLGSVFVEEFPIGIENLFHLRYLTLNAPSINSIPASLCNLRNLYTLDMPFSNIYHTPDNFWNMQKLRYLNFCLITLTSPSGIPESTLGDLQFLSLLNASSCSVDVLSRMTNLQTLRIYGDLGSHHEALSVNLSRLSCLKSLRLVGNKPAKFLGEYKFPSSLTHLTLLSTELKDDPMPTLENLPMLLVLKLKHNSYSGRKLACTSGKFPCLQVLHLKSMQWLEEWTMEPGAMPELVSLVINPCAYLRRLPEELWRVKTFCKLELWWPRPELKPKLREFEDMDQYDIQIHPSGL